MALAWKLEKGKPFYQEMTTETSQTTTVLGQNVTQNQKVTYFLSWTPAEKNRNGNWKVKEKIEAVKMEIEIGGNKIPFDSTKNVADANPLFGFFKAIAGSEFLLTLDNDMKVSKIEGRDDFVKKLTKENQGMAPLLKSIMSDEALKQTPMPNAGGTIPFKVLKADLTSKDGKGQILFDSNKGRVVYSNMTMNLRGTLTIEIGGEASDVTFEYTQTTTVKTTDENPIPKKSPLGSDLFKDSPSMAVIPFIFAS